MCRIKLPYSYVYIFWLNLNPILLEIGEISITSLVYHQYSVGINILDFQLMPTWNLLLPVSLFEFDISHWLGSHFKAAFEENCFT